MMSINMLVIITFNFVKSGLDYLPQSMSTSGYTIFIIFLATPKGVLGSKMVMFLEDVARERAT